MSPSDRLSPGPVDEHAAQQLPKGDVRQRVQLRAALAGLSTQRLRPPKSKTTRSYSVTTLERWYYAFRARQLDGLKPAPLSDKGRAQELSTEQRQLLCDIRREFPSSASLILRCRPPRCAVSSSTTGSTGCAAGQRWREDAAAVAGGTAGRPLARRRVPLVIDGKTKPLRIHALMDDASRYGGRARAVLG